MSQFTTDSEIIKYISKTFGFSEEAVNKLKTQYNELHKRLKSHFLAHIIRSLEDFVRETQNAPFFKITCHPSSISLDNIGSASYTKGLLYDINYDKDLDPVQARVVIAHELSHLFYMVITGKEYTKSHEPISSILGIFTIADKNDFYSNKENFLLHKSYKDIVDDFKMIMNRTKEKFNLS